MCAIFKNCIDFTHLFEGPSMHRFYAPCFKFEGPSILLTFFLCAKNPTLFRIVELSGPRKTAQNKT